MKSPEHPDGEFIAEVEYGGEWYAVTLPAPFEVAEQLCIRAVMDLHERGYAAESRILYADSGLIHHEHNAPRLIASNN